MFDIASSLAGLPAFAMYFIASVVALFAFMKIYTLITPHDEVLLIKDNNPVAALTYAGALIGFVLPLASASLNSVALLDYLVWAAVAAVAQVVLFFAFRVFYPRVSERIKNGEIAVGIKLAAWSVSVGILNAVSMTY